MKSRLTNDALIVATFGAAILTAAVFLTRFTLPGFLLMRLIDPLVGALLVIAASYATGSLVLRVILSRPSTALRTGSDGEGSPDSCDILLLGIPLFGLVLSIVAIAGFATPIVIGTITILLGIYGAIIGWRHVLAIRVTTNIAILIPPGVLAFLGAITPVNTPDELTYKLAVPHLYLQFGRMLDLPLNSHSYIPSAVYMADLGALVVSSGIAAKLVHFVIYLLALRVIYRTASDLEERGAMWITAAFAWTPALAIIAGWAWAEWAMIGLVLLSFLHFERGNLDVAAVALGCALSTKYTALPWAVVFLAIAIWRTVEDRRSRLSGQAGLPVLRGALITFATGAFFYIRNWIWTGSPIAPFLLPNSPAIADYRSSLGGWAELARGYDIFHPAIVDDALGILLPALILLSPLALFWRNRRVVDLFLLGIIQFIALVTLAPTSRLMILALVPLALLGGFVTVRVWELSNRAIRVALASLAGIAIAAQFVLLAFIFVARWSVMPYLAGLESEAAYLARTRDFVPAYTWMADHTPPDAKLLLLAENRTYHLDRRALAAGNLDGPRVATYLARFHTPAEFARELHEQGITHIVIHKPWYRVGRPVYQSMVEKEYLLFVAPRTHVLLHDFMRVGARRVYEDESYAIFELNR
jgi:hypothetical protein